MGRDGKPGLVVSSGGSAFPITSRIPSGVIRGPAFQKPSRLLLLTGDMSDSQRGLIMREKELHLFALGT